MITLAKVACLASAGVVITSLVMLFISMNPACFVPMLLGLVATQLSAQAVDGRRS